MDWNGESIELILDSTGMRFDKASHWYKIKYSKVCGNKLGRKLHLAMDPEMNIYRAEITDDETSDIDEMSNLISDNPDSEKVESVTADGILQHRRR